MMRASEEGNRSSTIYGECIREAVKIKEMDNNPDVTIDEARRHYNELSKEFNSPLCNDKNCDEYLKKLKILLAELDFLQLDINKPLSKEIMILSRNILEIGAQMSIRKKDVTSFERYITQLKLYYYDLREELPSESNKMYTLLGMNLLRLLMNNQIAEFHTELELMGPERIDNPYIQYPIKIEQYLTEGSYNKVWKSWEDVPVKEYLFFVETLSLTIRNEIATCIQKAYNSLPISDAAVLMYLSKPEDIYYFVDKYNWIVDEKTKEIHFKASDPEPEMPTAEKLCTFLDYARELEEII